MIIVLLCLKKWGGGKPKTRDLTTEEKIDISAVALPRYWISATEVEQKLDTQFNKTHSLTHSLMAKLKQIARSSLSEISGELPTNER